MKRKVGGRRKGGGRGELREGGREGKGEGKRKVGGRRNGRGEGEKEGGG